MNIRVDLNYPIKDGTEVVFRSPVDCSQVTGLKVYYREENGAARSKEFAFADAHGNNVGDIDHLFAENVVVKVILDVTTGMAFVQNADTNAYLEGRFAEAVTHTPQELTEEQKAQARKNIGAVWQGYYGIIIQGQDSIAEIEVVDKPDDAGYKQTSLKFLGYEDGTVKLSRITDGTADWDAATVGQVKEMVSQSGGGGGSADGLPVVSASDAGKVLRVSSNGVWAAQSLINAEEVAF